MSGVDEKASEKAPAIGIVRRVVTILLFAVTVVIMVFTVFSVMNFNKNEGRAFLGYRFYIVASGSMWSEFQPGDVIASKQAADPAALGESDIITFRSIDPANYDETVTHKIREKTTYEGKPAFITFGTTTDVDDAYPALAEKVMGVYTFRIPKAGYAIQFLKTPAGYFSVIFAPFLLLILFEGLRFFSLIKKYRREQLAEIEEEKAQAAAERLRAEDMLKEIAELKAQLSNKSDPQ